MTMTANNTKTAPIGSVVQGYDLDTRAELSLETNSQDIEATLSYFSDAELKAAGVKRGDVTAILCDVQDGDYSEVWAAETRYPGACKAYYTRIR